MFPIQQITRNGIRLLPNMRAVSDKAKPLVNLTIDDKGIAIVSMQRRPMNIASLELLQQLCDSLDEVSKNKCKGMILTSAIPNVFSGGYDVTEMHNVTDLERAAKSWYMLQEFWIKLFGARFITAAAITGHALGGGGCLPSMSCEHRVMVSGKWTIGLNESPLGIVAPPFFTDTMRYLLSDKESEFALTTGKRFSVEEAKKIGLIDEIAKDKDDAIEKCKKFINKFDNIPTFAREETKLRLRHNILKKLLDTRKEDVDLFLHYVKDKQTQDAITRYLNNFNKKVF